jgi:hypothetical protein
MLTEANQYTLLNALSFSLNLEQSIIEKKSYPEVKLKILRRKSCCSLN